MHRVYRKYSVGVGEGEMTEVQIPTQSLKETLTDLKTIVSGNTGENCPRCGGTDFNKAGFSKLLGKKSRRLCCRDCGYMFGVSELEEEFSRNRASRAIIITSYPITLLCPATTTPVIGSMQTAGPVRTNTA